MGDLATLLARVRAATSALPPQELPEGDADGRPGLAGAARSEQIAWMSERLTELRGPGDDAPAVVEDQDPDAGLFHHEPCEVQVMWNAGRSSCEL